MDLVINWTREYSCDIWAKNLCVVFMLEQKKADLLEIGTIKVSLPCFTGLIH